MRFIWLLIALEWNVHIREKSIFNWNSKASIKVLRFSKDIYQEIRPRACNFLLAKLSSESFLIPSKVSVVLVASETSNIDTLIGVFELRSRWLLPGLSLRWLYSIQWKSLLDVICSSAMTDWVSFPQEHGVVSSAYHFSHICRINQ